MDWIIENLPELRTLVEGVFAVVLTIVALTPTQTDDNFVARFRNLVSVLMRKGDRDA